MEPPQISFVKDYIGPPQISFCHYMGDYNKSVSSYTILYEGPNQISFFAYNMEALLGALYLNSTCISPPLQINFSHTWSMDYMRNSESIKIMQFLCILYI